MPINAISKIIASNKNTTILLGITILGALLRFYHLDFESLWYDELASWQQSSKSTVGEVFEGMRRNVHPPGWTIFLYFVQNLLGDSEFALRLPSAIVGVLSIPALYMLGKHLFDSKVGLIAALFLATMWAPISYSQESRAYALLIFLSIVTLYLLLLIIERMSKGHMYWPIALLYILTCSAMSYLHYSGLLMVVLQGCWAFCRTLPNLRLAAVIAGIYFIQVLLYSPWLLEVLSDLERTKFWLNYIASPANVLNFFFFKGKNLLIVLGILSAVIGFAIAMEILNLYRRKVQLFKSPVLLLSLMLIGPYVAFYAKSLIGTPILIPRYILVSIPAAYLLLAVGICQLFRNQILISLTSLAVVAASFWVIFFQINYYTEPQKTDLKRMFIHIRDSPVVALEDTRLISYRAWSGYRYYKKRLGIGKKVDYSVSVAKNLGGKISPAQVEKLNQLIDKADTDYLWVVIGTSRTPKSLITTISDRADLIESKRFEDAGAWLFKKR